MKKILLLLLLATIVLFGQKNEPTEADFYKQYEEHLKYNCELYKKDIDRLEKILTDSIEGTTIEINYSIPDYVSIYNCYEELITHLAYWMVKNKFNFVLKPRLITGNTYYIVLAATPSSEYYKKDQERKRKEELKRQEEEKKKKELIKKEIEKNNILTNDFYIVVPTNSYTPFIYSSIKDAETIKSEMNLDEDYDNKPYAWLEVYFYGSSTNNLSKYRYGQSAHPKFMKLRFDDDREWNIPVNSESIRNDQYFNSQYNSCKVSSYITYNDEEKKAKSISFKYSLEFKDIKHVKKFRTELENSSKVEIIFGEEKSTIYTELSPEEIKSSLKVIDYFLRGIELGQFQDRYNQTY